MTMSQIALVMLCLVVMVQLSRHWLEVAADYVAETRARRRPIAED